MRLRHGPMPFKMTFSQDLTRVHRFLLKDTAGALKVLGIGESKVLLEVKAALKENMKTVVWATGGSEITVMWIDREDVFRLGLRDFESILATAADFRVEHGQIDDAQQTVVLLFGALDIEGSGRELYDETWAKLRLKPWAQVCRAGTMSEAVSELAYLTKGGYFYD